MLLPIKTRHSLAFLLPGCSARLHRDLIVKDDETDTRNRYKHTMGRIANLEEKEVVNQYVRSFVKVRRSLPGQDSVDFKAGINPLNSYMITWTRFKPLKRSFDLMISGTDTLGELEVSIPVICTRSTLVINN